MNNKKEEEKKKMSMNMSNIKITKYNPKLKLDEDCDECNFYEQLSDREKEEYNDLKINFLERLIFSLKGKFFFFSKKSRVHEQ